MQKIIQGLKILLILVILVFSSYGLFTTMPFDSMILIVGLTLLGVRQTRIQKSIKESIHTAHKNNIENQKIIIREIKRMVKHGKL